MSIFLSKLPKIFGYTLVGLIGILIFGLFIGTGYSMPQNAQIYIDDSNRTYISPPCIEDKSISEKTTLRLATAKEADDLKYSPDANCRDTGGFEGGSSNLTVYLFERLGLVKVRESRWDDNGRWRK